MAEDGMAIVARGLVKRYRGVARVDGVHLDVRDGSLFSLLGPNGAGKTTTIKMLSCLTRPDSGAVSILGVDAFKEGTRARGLLAVSPQETAIAGRLSARENLLLMAGLYGIPRLEGRLLADELLASFGLSERAKEASRTLSGGMQRKLSIAMALVARPHVLFLDEPSLGLDPEARRELWQMISTLKGKMTILLTTHYLEEADALSDTVAFIDKGRIVAKGTPAELKARYGAAQTLQDVFFAIADNGGKK